MQGTTHFGNTSANMTSLHPDRPFPERMGPREVARPLYDSVRGVPILSPHGHMQASWFADNVAFSDSAKLFIQPDHYVHRMLYSQGIALEELEIGVDEICDPRPVWHIFAQNCFLFCGTPTQMWLSYSFQERFGLEEPLNSSTADKCFDTILEKLKTPQFRPLTLYDQFRIEVLSTTNSPLHALSDREVIRTSDWKACILPTFLPDCVVGAELIRFSANIEKQGEQLGEDTATWRGYLAASRCERERFLSLGCTVTDHGHPMAQTASHAFEEAAALYRKIVAGTAEGPGQELFRAQMLTEMDRKTLADGLVMQIHSGSGRYPDQIVHQKFGSDMGADIPARTNYVERLHPLLNLYGNQHNVTIILLTFDRSTRSRELAPHAGHYACRRLGPLWYFHDSPEGKMRYRESVTETAVFTTNVNLMTIRQRSYPSRQDTTFRVAPLGRFLRIRLLNIKSPSRKRSRWFRL